jgi:hypothetical protein
MNLCMGVPVGVGVGVSVGVLPGVGVDVGVGGVAGQAAKAAPLTFVPGEKSAPPEPLAVLCFTNGSRPMTSGSRVSD